MATLFHINHDKTAFYPGARLLLQSIKANKHPEFQDEADRLNALFPEGLSVWGAKFLCGLLDNPFICTRENLCEEIRRQLFPHRPSRLQAIFCFETVAVARQYRTAWGKLDSLIWEIETTEEPFRGDMRWLEPQPNNLRERLINYWAQMSTSQPVWEYLVVPPAMVVTSIDEESHRR